LNSKGLWAKNIGKTTTPISNSSLRNLYKRLRETLLRTEKTKTLLVGSAFTVLIRPLGHVLRLILATLLARFLGASDYGIYVYAVTWLGVLTIPSTLGLDHIVLRFVAIYKGRRTPEFMNGLLRHSSLLAAIAGFGVAILALTVVAVIPGLDRVFRITMMLIIAILPVAVLTQVRQSFLRGLDHPILAQIPENVIYPLSFSVALVALFMITGGFPSVVEAATLNLAAWIIAFVVGIVFIVRVIPPGMFLSRPRFERPEWNSMIPALIFVGISYNILSRGEIVILGIFKAPADVGVYTIANRGAELMLFAYEATTIAGASLFSSIYASGDLEELQRFTNLITRMILWVTLPVFVLFLVFAPFFLSIFGPEFVGGVPALRLLTVTYFISSLGGFVIIMLHMTGHQRDVAYSMAAVAVLNIVLAFILIPPFGIFGAAIGSGVSLIVLKGVLVIVLYKRVGVVSLPFRIDFSKWHRGS